jgi:hypothetical protein
MLKKTVYFRDQEDLDKFNALPNKAEWLHEHLNPRNELEAHIRAMQELAPDVMDEFVKSDQPTTEPINAGPNFPYADAVRKHFDDPTIEPFEESA